MKKPKSIIDRAAELLRENKGEGMKYYQAMEQARREFNEMDKGAVPGISKAEK